jgi:stage V sporulation protein AB
MIIKYILLMLLGLGGGIVISGAVFAFIAIIGIVPRMAEKTKTLNFIKRYETAIICGGFLGVFTICFDYYLPLNRIIVVIISLSIGIFYGCLAVSLAEVLNVIPILSRRMRLNKGIKYFILSLALGKTIGSFLYYFVPGFYY